MIMTSSEISCVNKMFIDSVYINVTVGQLVDIDQWRLLCLLIWAL